MKLNTLAALTLLYATLAGCVSVPAPPPQPSMQNLEVLKASRIAPLSVGEFALEPGKPAEMDQSVSMRGSTLYPPSEGSFARYLRQALIAELQTAGKYDASSATVIRGWLTDSQLDASGVSIGTASLGARFAVSRGNQVVYEREHTVSTQWESSFVGAIAIPAAINEYTALFRKLLEQLFRDQGFAQAAAAP